MNAVKSARTLLLTVGLAAAAGSMSLLVTRAYAAPTQPGAQPNDRAADPAAEPRPMRRPPRPPMQAVPGDHGAEIAVESEHARAHDAEAKEKAEEEDENAPPKPINWTDFGNKDQAPYLAALINFAILAFVYVYFGRKPIAAALTARREEVSKQIEEAQRIKREAEARSTQYASKLEDLGQELEATKGALAAAGATEKARIVREAEEKAHRMERDAEFMLQQERKQLRLDLQREAVAAAIVEAEQLLRTKLTAADQERVAEEFLVTLRAPAKAGRPDTTGGAS